MISKLAAGGHYRDGTFKISDALYSGPQYAPSYDIWSDARLKSNVLDHEPLLEALMSLKVKTFDVKRVLHRHDGTVTMYSDPPTQSVGLLAQDVRKVLPKLVHGDERNGFLSVNEGKIGVLVLHALQEFVTETRQAIKELQDGHSAH